MKKGFLIVILAIISMLLLCVATACSNNDKSVSKEELLHSLSINSNGELVFAYDDETSKIIGKVVGLNGSNGKNGVGISKGEINSDGELVFTFDNGTIENYGEIVGGNGQDGSNGKNGVGILTAEINEDGDLVLLFDDGNSKNLGKVVAETQKTYENAQGLDFYLLDDDTYAVSCGKAKYLSLIEIPPTYKGKAVSSILDSAFLGCRNLKKVKIPNSVLSIGSSSFKNCSSLFSLEIGSSVSSIGENAFYNCHKLVEVYNLSKLPITKGSILNGYVGNYAKEIYSELNEASKLSTNADGYVIWSDGESKSIIAYCGTEKNLVLPNDITEINQYAFYNCTELISIEIGELVQKIGDYSFYNCTSLTEMNFGSGINSIGINAFNLTGLESVAFENANGWWYSSNSTATSGTSLSLGNNSSNATLLKTTYSNFYWHRL